MRQWYAVHMKGKKLSATTRMFLDFLLRDGARIWQESQPHLRIPAASQSIGPKAAGTARRAKKS
jgi:hypothetical protein